MKGTLLIWAIGVSTFTLFAALEAKTRNKQIESKYSIDQVQPFIETIPEPSTPNLPNITTQIPPYLSYSEIVTQLKKWEQEAFDLAEVGFYGKTKKGTEICYIKICNKLENKNRPKVFITGCIHGNESWSTGCVMAYAGNLLDSYGKNKEIKDLIESREIYIIPVVSPDSYPHQRNVDGVDPNRDFPGPSRPHHKSTESIKAIQTFFLKIKPNAVISGHTFGRVFLTPFGDIKNDCLNEADYQRIIGKMCKLCNYRMDHTCNNYNRPIQGTEVDWYYRNGAFSVVMEFGTHQKMPTKEEITNEYLRTWEGILFFLKEAPIIPINANIEDFDFLGNTGIADTHHPLSNELVILKNQ